jgi:hypothetical protein
VVNSDWGSSKPVRAAPRVAADSQMPFVIGQRANGSIASITDKRLKKEFEQ